MPAVAILLLVLQIGGVELSPRWLAMCGRGVIIVVWVWSLTWSNYRCGLCGCVGLGPAKAHMIREKEDENEKREDREREKEMREDREREKDA